MGVLDDAIREHLELKRKHGAPEEELRRQAEEALGPVRREVAPPDEVQVDGDGESAAAAQEPAVEPVAEGGEAGEPAPFDAETALLAEPEPEPFPEEEAPAVAQPAEPAEPLPEPEESAELEEQAVVHPRDGSDGRTVPTIDGDGDGDGVDPEDEPRRAGEVLEDTPDFLEETPEHDRLWFEQKPRRDFDFD